jgi:hypothetical protein
MRTLCIGVSSWIIQDGNYGEFTVGDIAEFAIEFHPHALQCTQSRKETIDRIKANRYRVCGRVVYASQTAWVIDFGAMAYQNQPRPAGCELGSWVEGEVYLGIDPFFYREELCRLPGMPKLQYEWHISRIFLETTPWLTSIDDRGAKTLTRDEQHESYIEASQTNAWTDDDGNAHYVLECETCGD